MLPRLNVATFPFTLPVTKREIHYRSFTVKEEKMLLIASESGEEKDMLQAFKQVIRNCITEDIDPGTLPIYDLEVLFLLLRVASVGPVANFQIQDLEDQEVYKFEVNLKEMVDKSVAETKIPDSKIQLSEDLGVVMKHITLDTFTNQSIFSGEQMSSEQAFEVLADMIDKVYDQENVYNTKDVERQEVLEFLESFTADAIQKLYDYMDSIPRVFTTIKYKTKAGAEKELRLEGLADFFQFA